VSSLPFHGREECSSIEPAAGAIIHRCGTDAADIAAMRAEAFLYLGDMEVAFTWRRVLTAIEQLQAEKPTPEEKVQ
jgi:hypothetical protein